MPRDWLKSSLYTKWGVLYDYLQNNECRILIAAENENLAGRFLQWIERQVLTNKKLRNMYPELKQVDKAWTRSHKWSKSECDLPRTGTYSEPTITAIGVGGAAQSGHYDVVAIDDLVGKKAKESPMVLESVMRWLDNAPELLVQPFRDMPNPSVIRIIGTFWFPGDFLCYVRDRYPEYKFKVVPCRRTLKESRWPQVEYVQNDSVEAGESNWPEQFPTEYYVEMLANPEKNIDYWAQHMNDPEQATELTTFDVGWYKYYHFEEHDGYKYIVCEDDKEQFRVGSFLTYAFLDPGGFTDKRLTKSGSRTAILIGGQPTGTRKKFVTYTWAGRYKNPDKFMDEIFKANDVARPVLWRQEIYAQQRYILDDIKKEAKKRGKPLRIIELESDERKDAKALNIDALKTPMFNGEIYIHSSMKDLISETQVYPNGMTKDLIDCLAQLNKTYWKRGEKKPLVTHSSYQEKISQGESRTGY
jgi:hypothetical protein